MIKRAQEHQPTQERIVFKGRLLPTLPSEYREPSLDNELITPHGAAPANPFKPEVHDQQRSIAQGTLLLYESPPQDMPAEFVEHVVTADFIINTERGKLDNFNAYAEFLKHNEVLDPSLAEPIDRFESAQAPIAEIVNILLNTRMESAEFGGLAHPYGYRMQYLEPLRKETTEAIESSGGVVYPTISPYRSIVIQPVVESFDNGTKYGGERIIGFIVKYKRDYGHIPIPGNDTEVIRVVERQVAAYRVDEASGFDQSVLRAMHDLRDEFPKYINWGIRTPDDPQNKKIAEYRLRVTGCSGFIEKAVQTDSLEDFVVPLETKIYGFRDKLPQVQKPDLVARAAIEQALSDSLAELPPSESDAHLFDY